MPEYDDRALFEKLILDGFQAGLSWITILRKRDNFRKAFDDFDPEKIARYTPRKVETLMQDAGIVRNRLKIEGTVRSAQSWLDIMDKGGGFSNLLWDHLDGRPKINTFKTLKGVPAETPLSRAISKDLGIARLQVRRTHHRLCLHAGGRDGERSSGDVPPARRMRQARAKGDERRVKAPRASAKPRAWQRMLSGRRLDLLDPSPLDIEIEDIAHGIARVPRWNGQTKGAHIFSVAQHTLLVDTIARQQGPLDDKLRLAIMLHDAPEYVVGDMITPFKTVIGEFLQGGGGAAARRHPSALRAAAEAAGGSGKDRQERRPRRRLSRSDTARRLRGG